MDNYRKKHEDCPVIIISEDEECVVDVEVDEPTEKPVNEAIDCTETKQNTGDFNVDDVCAEIDALLGEDKIVESKEDLHNIIEHTRMSDESGDESNYQHCYICGKSIQGDLLVFNDHVNKCLDDKNKNEEQTARNVQKCFICQMAIHGDLNALNEHVNLCLDDKGETSMANPETFYQSNEHSQSSRCTICDEMISGGSDAMNTHMNHCLDAALSTEHYVPVKRIKLENPDNQADNISCETDKDGSDPEDDDQRCPLCGYLISGDLDVHVNTCLDQEELPDTVVPSQVGLEGKSTAVFPTNIKLEPPEEKCSMEIVSSKQESPEKYRFVEFVTISSGESETERDTKTATHTQDFHEKIKLLSSGKIVKQERSEDKSCDTNPLDALKDTYTGSTKQESSYLDTYDTQPIDTHDLQDKYKFIEISSGSSSDEDVDPIPTAQIKQERASDFVKSAEHYDLSDNSTGIHNKHMPTKEAKLKLEYSDHDKSTVARGLYEENSDELPDLQPMRRYKSPTRQRKNTGLVKEEKQKSRVFDAVTCNCIDACLDEGGELIGHGIQLLQDFTNTLSYPPDKYRNYLLKSLCECQSTVETYDAYNTLKLIDHQHPPKNDMTWFTWEDLETSLTSLCNGHDGVTPQAWMNRILAVQYMVDTLKNELNMHDMDNLADLHKSFIYRWLHVQTKFLRIKTLIELLYGCLTLDEYDPIIREMEMVHIAEPRQMLLPDLPKLLPIIQELLHLTLKVSTDVRADATRIAFEMRDIYSRIPQLYHRHLLLKTIKSSHLLLMLTKMLLEENSGGSAIRNDHLSIGAIVDYFYDCRPPRNFLMSPPPSPSGSMSGHASACYEDRDETYSSESCEELVILLFFMMYSFIEISTENNSLIAQEIVLIPQHVELLRNRLCHMSITGSVSPTTEVYLCKLDCLQDCDT